MLAFKETAKFSLICFGAIVFNFVGYSVSKIFNLPLYLDTAGTIFIAALGGIAPGIIVGFFTNLFGAVFDNGSRIFSDENSAMTTFDFNEIYFSSVNVIIALVTVFLFHRNYYSCLRKVIMTIPATVFITTTLGLTIQILLSFSGETIFLNELKANFVEKFFWETCDKGLMILTAYFALKFVPTEISNKFHTLGQKQAQLDDARLIELSARNFKFSSLRTKMLFTVMALVVFTAVAVSMVSYILYKDSAVKERIKIADGITTMVANTIEPNRVEDYLANGRAAEGYNDIERELYRIRASNSDIRFLYVYKIMEDGCHVVFDLATSDMEASVPGEVVEFDEEFYPVVPALLEGKPIQPKISNGQFGYLLTIYKPVYNHVGKCVCYAAIDFSMDRISEYGKSFVIKIIVLLMGSFAFIFILGLVFIENNIILPVNSMAWCTEKFSYKDAESRSRNIALIKSLDIRTDDEIEHLYRSLMHSIEDGMNTFDSLRDANIKVAVMDELAHTDSLTGIKNKTAYVELTAELDKKIAAAANVNFCIVMVDVNFLKRVNDTYGHERGNEYLINACKLVCEIFGEENVFRVGGDEFVAVLTDTDAVECRKLVYRINAEIKKFRSNKSLEPWEKISAAVGEAFYCAGDDHSCEEVFKRADSQMYKNKLAMKATRTD